jgi:hypothetical protein
MFKKYWLRLLAVSGIAISLALSLISPCSAITTVGAIVTLNSTNVYENALAQGDLLFTTDYTVYYSSTPSEPISSTFILRLVNNSTSLDIADTVPFPYFNNGYVNTTGVSAGQIAIYFSPAQVISGFGSQTSAWSAGSGGGYYLLLAGNPTSNWTGGGNIPSSSQLSSIGFNWKSSVSVAVTAAIISQDILAEAVNLTNAWNNANYVLETPTGTGSGFLLTTVGQDYFTSVLPNLATLAPTILISPSNAAFNIITTTPPATMFANQIGSDFAGSALDPTNSASAFHIGVMWLGILMTLSIMGFVLVMSAKRANTYKAVIITAFPLLYVFVRIGWFPMLLAIGFGLMAIFELWYVFFYEKQIT